jgi:hypothetical protein
MARKKPAKKLLEAAFKAIKSLEERKLKADGVREIGTMPAEDRLSKRGNQARRKRRVQKLAGMLEKPIGNAFEKSGLDIDNDQDWKKLLIWILAAIYGGKGPGQPKKWSTNKLRKLQQEIDNIKNQHSGHLKELDCCKRLIRKSENNRYNGVGDAETLRRVLQNAKRVSKDVQLLASVRDDAVATDLMNELKERR